MALRSRPEREVCPKRDSTSSFSLCPNSELERLQLRELAWEATPSSNLRATRIWRRTRTAPALYWPSHSLFRCDEWLKWCAPNTSPCFLSWQQCWLFLLLFYKKKSEYKFKYRKKRSIEILHWQSICWFTIKLKIKAKEKKKN